MSLRFCRLLAAHTLLVFLPVVGFAQPGEASQFRVEVKTGGGPATPGYSCELSDIRLGQKFGYAYLHADGTFFFRGVPYGDYRLTITGANNEVLHQELVTVSQINTPVVVELPKKEVQRPPSGPVSVDQLQHPPARRAFQAMVAAQRFSEAGDYRRAAGELEKAVHISPDYADAYSNLGAQHIRLGEYAQAVEEIRRAMELAKPNPMEFCNLAYAQIQLQRYDEAFESVRAALRLDGNYAQAHYLMGALLARDKRTLPEALPHLERAARVMPSAQVFLEQARKLAH